MNQFYTNVLCKGNNILYRGYDSLSNRIQKKIRYSPRLFVESIDKKTEWKSLEGRHLEEMSFGTINDCRDFLEDYKDVSGIRIYGHDNFVYNFLETQENVLPSISDLRIAYFDIETECENGFPSVEDHDQKINAITLHVTGNFPDRKFDTYTFCTERATPKNEKHMVFCFSSEKDMLTTFLTWWKDMDFDVITGWNINLFDIPYMVNRIQYLFDEETVNEFSPWGYIKTRKVVTMNREHMVYDLCGIAALDYLDLYRKFTFVNRESYRLDHIAYVELGQRKSSFEGFDTIQDLYKKDFNKFIEYNHQDVMLITKLEQKLKLLELAINLAYSSKVNLMDVFSQVRLWDCIIYYHLMKKGIVIPHNGREAQSKNTQFAGGYVKEPKVGMHDWVVSYDLDSLYPSLILLFNISPDTKKRSNFKGEVSLDNILNMDSVATERIQKAKEINSCMSANGVLFDKEVRGFLPELIHEMYQERKDYKKKMLECKTRLKENRDSLSEKEIRQLELDISKYHIFQTVKKVCLNSAFGTVGNQYFRHFDIDLAEAITLSGQLVIRWIERDLNQYLNKMLGTENEDFVIASDTDSVYIRLNDVVKKFIPDKQKKNIVEKLDRFCNDMLSPFIQKSCQRFHDQLNCPVQSLNMKREVIADKAVWTAKKRYMMNVYMGEDNVLLSEPEMKIMGIEVVRSSTPQVVRDALKEGIHIILNEDEKTLMKYISNFRKKFDECEVEEISFPRTCSDVTKYSDSTLIYKKSTPIAVKGALLYNHAIQKKKLQKKHSLIKDGDKVKFVYLKEPNPIGGKVVSFPNVLPKELDVHKYVDRQLQFEKTFLEPLKTITESIHWSTEKKATLESLFV